MVLKFPFYLNLVLGAKQKSNDGINVNGHLGKSSRAKKDCEYTLTGLWC